MTEFLQRLAKLLGSAEIITGPAIAEHMTVHPVVGRSDTAPLALVRPRSVEQVSTVLALCHGAGQAVIPVGGRTGLVQGIRALGGELLVSLDRLNRIEAVDVVGRTMTVEAGVPLQLVHERAEDDDLFFPLDLGARGSATIGGTIATNAGGNRVIRYGMMREMVLGLEVVLADGTCVSSMNRMIKNNAGYDLKQLFIGTEGTLGIVTRAVLRLHRLPKSQHTAFVGLSDFGAVIALLDTIDAALGGSLSAFEVMWRDFYRLVTMPPAQNRPPLGYDYPYYVLLESLGSDQEVDGARFETALFAAHQSGIVADAAIAKSQAERDAMWAMRDDVGQTSQLGTPVAYDVSLPIGDMRAYVEQVKGLITRHAPAARPMVFGHLGDGNLHIIVALETCGGLSRAEIDDVVYAPLKPLGGSISAEHGIGLTKRRHLQVSRSRAEINLMRTLKSALDPKGILNPQKVFAPGQKVVL